MKKVLLLLIIGWMSMTAYAQLTAGFYGGDQSITLGSVATLEFRFEGAGPVDFSYSDGMYYYHEYEIYTSPYYFTVEPSSTTTYELCVVRNKFVVDGMIDPNHRFITVTISGSPQNVQMTFNLPQFICQNGDPIRLTDYVWTNVTNPTFSFEGPGVFGNFFYPSSGLCGTNTIKVSMTYDGAIYSTQASVSVLEVPQVTLWLPSEVFVNESPFVLSGGRPSGGYYWGDGVVNGNTFNPAIAGEGWHTIYYSYTTANGCQDVAESKIYVRRSGNAVEETVEDSFAVYPNPTDGVVFFTKPCSVDIFSTMCLVRRENSFVGSVDISDLPNGVYVFRLFDGENIAVKRIVKK